jgi:hypothetical protein
MLLSSRSRCAAVAHFLLSGFLAVAGLHLVAPPTVAGLFTLIDHNSSMVFNTASSGNASDWIIDGVDQLSRQAFWFRVGNTAEQSVHSLPIAFESATNTNVDPNLDTLFVRYLGAGFRIDIRYSLDGGLPGSLASDMAEQISISNTGISPLDFHFFQFNDFDLNATSSDDLAVFTNANAVQQYEGSMRLSETVVTPVPNHREIDFHPATLAKLADAAPTTLSDTPATSNVLGPGDVTWAFQWDFVLPAGGTFQISKDKHLSGVPEPTAALLLLVGAGLFSGARRTR